MIVLLIAVQFILLIVLTFGDIGFHHPGRFGMSFNHGIVISACYFVALLCGIGYSIVKKNWKTAIPQLFLPVLFLVYDNFPAPRYRAQDYQHLVGTTETHVNSVLSSRQTISGSTKGLDGIRYDITYYKGMTVYYGTDGIVTKVVVNND